MHMWVFKLLQKILYPWTCVRASCVFVCEHFYLSSCTSVISFFVFQSQSKERVCMEARYQILFLPHVIWQRFTAAAANWAPNCFFFYFFVLLAVAAARFDLRPGKTEPGDYSQKIVCLRSRICVCVCVRGWRNPKECVVSRTVSLALMCQQISGLWSVP